MFSVVCITRFLCLYLVMSHTQNHFHACHIDILITHYSVLTTKLSWTFYSFTYLFILSMIG